MEKRHVCPIGSVTWIVTLGVVFVVLYESREHEVCSAADPACLVQFRLKGQAGHVFRLVNGSRGIGACLVISCFFFLNISCNPLLWTRLYSLNDSCLSNKALTLLVQRTWIESHSFASVPRRCDYLVSHLLSWSFVWQDLKVELYLI